MKIFISGVSGTGKTTLAKYISQRYRIPFIEGSSKVLWAKHGITKHSDIIAHSTEDPKWGLDFQTALLNYRGKSIEGFDDFVTDRSPLDSMVYFLLQNAPHLTKDVTDEYFESCKNSYPLGSRQILLELCTEDDMVFENDGMRIDNPHYQMVVNSVFSLMAGNIPINVDIINYWNWDNRVNIVEYLLKKEPILWRVIKKMFGQ